MFLTERLISLFVYAAALTAAYWLIARVVRQQWKTVLFLYLITLCVFAFCYKPYITADLYRLRQYMKYWINLPAEQIISYAFRKSSPAWVLYSYLINKLGNPNWLQTITCLWCFGNVFYIIAHEIDRNGIRYNSRSLLLLYVMAIGAFYLQTISGIRSMLGISIIVFCFYCETIENKSVLLHLPLYLFAALLHSAVIPLVIVRFTFLVIQYKSISKKILFSALIVGLGLFSIHYLRNYISDALNKGQSYMFGDQEYTYIWEILIGLLETAATWYVMRQYKVRYTNGDSADQYNALRIFCMIWSIISIIALPFSYSVFRRYTIFCTLLSLPLMAKILQYEQENENQSNFKTYIWLLLIATFILSGVRGDLCGYKFFTK